MVLPTDVETAVPLDQDLEEQRAVLSIDTGQQRRDTSGIDR